MSKTNFTYSHFSQDGSTLKNNSLSSTIFNTVWTYKANSKITNDYC